MFALLPPFDLGHLFIALEKAFQLYRRKSHTVPTRQDIRPDQRSSDLLADVFFKGLGFADRASERFTRFGTYSLGRTWTWQTGCWMQVMMSRP